MNKKQVRFIVLLTVAAFFLWLAGEILIGIVFGLPGTVSVVWAVIMVIATLALSVYKCCFNEEDSKRKKNSRRW
ncbi:MAG: hypothetical protein ACI4I9_01595 [Porcipelethomonas sp.]